MFILSEELRAMLPDAEVEESRKVEVGVKINFVHDHTIEGQLLAFTKSVEEHKYIIECAAADAINCLAEHEVETIGFKSNIDDRDFFVEKSSDETTTVHVEFYSPANTKALLTVVIGEKKASLAIPQKRSQWLWVVFAQLSY